MSDRSPVPIRVYRGSVPAVGIGERATYSFDPGPGKRLLGTAMCPPGTMTCAEEPGRSIAMIPIAMLPHDDGRLYLYPWEVMERAKLGHGGMTWTPEPGEEGAVTP